MVWGELQSYKIKQIGVPFKKQFKCTPCSASRGLDYLPCFTLLKDDHRLKLFELLNLPWQ